jgi:hypothetical protein
MQSTQSLTLLLVFAFTGIQGQADSHEESPMGPGVLEGYFCNYNSGKDRDDLDANTRFYLQQADKAGIDVPDAYLWTLSKGAAPADFVWMNVYESMGTWAAADDASAASSEMAAVVERSNSIITCQPALAQAVVVYQDESASIELENGVLGAFACDLRQGMGPAALTSLNSQVAQLNMSMGEERLNGVVQIVPFTVGPTTPDVVYVAVATDMADFAAHMDALATTPAGQSASAHFNSVLDCNVNIWRSERIIGGDD